MNDRKIDITKMNNERKELHILSLEQFSEFATTLSNHTNMDNAKFAAGLGLQLADIRIANQLIEELGLTGKAVIKEIQGKSYVVLKGYPGLREKLTGTRYLASNPKVVDLAIGVVIGAAFGKIVSSFIEDVITPLLLKPALEAANLEKIQDLTILGGVKYGMFLSAVINFIIIAFVLFLIIKGMNAAKKKKEEAPVPPAGPTQEELLTQIRDLLKK